MKQLKLFQEIHNQENCCGDRNGRERMKHGEYRMRRVEDTKKPTKHTNEELKKQERMLN